jgi:dTMP kinase
MTFVYCRLIILSDKLMAAKRGALIIFEGLDRIGKTTQSKLLFDYLSRECDLLCERLAFPDRSTQIGSLIDAYLQRKIEFNDHTIHLLFSANRWECMDSMRTKLLQGYTLIVDRYAYSGVAFSQAKGLDPTWCQSCDIGLLKPDLVLYFHRDKQSNCLSYTGDERYETKQFQEKVETYFEQFRTSSHEWKDVIVNSKDNLTMRDKESIQNEIRLYVRDCLAGIKTNHLDELWKKE